MKKNERSKGNRNVSRLSDEEYKNLWEDLKIEIRMVEKAGDCKHKLGDIFYYESPYKRPEKVCFALLHVLDLYAWRAALGYPSWNPENRDVFRIHCPDATGTVWEMKRFKASKS